MIDESPWWQALSTVRADVAQDARWEAWDLLQVEYSRTRLLDRVTAGSVLQLTGGYRVLVVGVDELLQGGAVLVDEHGFVLVLDGHVRAGYLLADRLPDESAKPRSVASILREHVGQDVSIDFDVQGAGGASLRLQGKLMRVGLDHIDVLTGHRNQPDAVVTVSIAHVIRASWALA